MSRLALLVVAFGLVVFVPRLPPEAQSAEKVYRIGVLEGVAAAANVENLAAFRQGLSDLGYVEGKNIVTRGTPAALSAKQTTATIPIVMASSGEPVAEASSPAWLVPAGM